MNELKKVGLTSEDIQKDCAGYIEQFRQDFPGIGEFVKDLKELESEVARLKAEVKRLTKAGDAMMDWIDHQHDDSGYPHSEAWEAAKEGKQP